MEYVKPDGKLSYITCSILPEVKGLNRKTSNKWIFFVLSLNWNESSATFCPFPISMKWTLSTSQYLWNSDYLNHIVYIQLKAEVSILIQVSSSSLRRVSSVFSLVLRSIVRSLVSFSSKSSNILYKFFWLSSRERFSFFSTSWSLSTSSPRLVTNSFVSSSRTRFSSSISSLRF